MRFPALDDQIDYVDRIRNNGTPRYRRSTITSIDPLQATRNGTSTLYDLDPDKCDDVRLGEPRRRVGDWRYV